MPSLKDIKNRITSVKGTRKITSAMKMIASAKLHKAQDAINNFLPYSDKLNSILSNLLSSDTGFDSPFANEREVKRVALVIWSSNSSLAGAFNSNVIKDFDRAYAELKQQVGSDENILVYPVGKKIAAAAKKRNVKLQGEYSEILDKVSYEQVSELSYDLINKFLKGEVDKIVLLYHHFKSVGSQVLVEKVLLPFDLNVSQDDAQATDAYFSDYILEPSKEEILKALIPKVLVSRMYAAFLDTLASEHAARTMAMQIATDNADELTQELTVLYNKSRQQAITNELLDIIAGAAALE